jgi:hypothetical protein
LLPRCNHSYATNNKIDQGHPSPLLLPVNWHQWPSKQELKLLAIVVVALVATIIIVLTNEIETK